MTTRLPVLPLRASILMIALATTACASIPDLGPAPVTRAPALQAEASRSLAGTGAAWPAEGWWDSYGDPQLSALIVEALAGSPDLEAAAARIRTAEGLAQRAGANLLPRAQGFAAVGGVKLSRNLGIPAEAVPGGWNDNGVIGLSLTYDLDLWGGNRAALRAAKLDAEAARYEAAEARLVLATGIASTWGDLATLHAERDSLVEARAIRRETLDLVAARVARGLDNEAALRQAQAHLAQTEAGLAAVDEAIALTRNALAALAGKGPDRALSIGRPRLDGFSARPLPANASIDLIGRRPDIAAARAAAEAAAERIGEARAAFYPDVTLNALVGLQAFGLGNLFGTDSIAGAAGPAITLPIFQGGALAGQYRARRGQQDEAVANYDRQVVAALRQTADVVASRQALVGRLAEQRRALDDFASANRMVRLRYEQGLATYLDVLAAEEGLLESRLAVARLETRAFTLDVALVRALGGGFQA